MLLEWDNHLPDTAAAKAVDVLHARAPLQQMVQQHAAHESDPIMHPTLEGRHVEKLHNTSD